jgi:perosamine synthetase
VPAARADLVCLATNQRDPQLQDGAREAASETAGAPSGGRGWIPLSSVDVGELERANVSAAMAQGWISGTGPFVEEFESRLGERTGRAHVVATANGTLALELALRAMEIGPGDEVIVPAFTFAAPAMSVLAVGAKPVVADVSAETWTLSPDRVAEQLSRRTRAILAVDVLGHPADYDALGEFGVPLIEDAAEAHGARYKGRPTGSFGQVSVFSFHANKAITTGEGGCAMTDSAQLAERMRLIANHGLRPDRQYLHDAVGRNFRMSNLSAAIGVAQLVRWESLIGARRRVSRRYDELLVGADYGGRPVAPWAEYSCWLHTIAVNDRARVLHRLREVGIDARAVWPALTRQPVLRWTGASSTVSEQLARRAMWLPTYNALSLDEIRFITGAVRNAIGERPEGAR